MAFVSEATNVVPGDTNGVADIFLRDRRAGTTVRVSGTNADAPSDAPSISANGRYVTFTSGAPLVPGDTNGVADVFIRDIRTGSLRRVNVSTTGTQANAVTVSPMMSADGRIVAFTSDATNLVPGDTNGVADVFLRDLRAGTTVRASLAANCGQGNGGSSYGPMMSADGRIVAFTSDATNLVPGDTNGVADVFLRDLRAGTTVRASLAANCGQGNGGSSYGPMMSADGRIVAFTSDATNLVPGDTNGVADVFLRDLRAGTTVRASLAANCGQGNGGSSYGPMMSADGRIVAFTSDATNLVPGDTNGVADVFLRDLRAGTTVRASLAADGGQGNGGSYNGVVSWDGRHVAFASMATNLVPGDTNGVSDAFLGGMPR
ncbi:hypothetical protein ENC19_16520 [Verrucosispora sp. CWR15]|uniref:Calcium-binding protein n=1 Tax=Verrucosispora sioxanthis TaxID=2499994 RepID=A0A6M1L7L0_9ACTN|nr:PD40 domain-containing protein [Verrucosispora sioxanthis]NEE65053.1 hypothetical protein [Verrucosispora sioxanthis]NGM14163.1 hypothetical protein [Verrucosispora sioxanthis]